MSIHEYHALVDQIRDLHYHAYKLIEKELIKFAEEIFHKHKIDSFGFVNGDADWTDSTFFYINTIEYNDLPNDLSAVIDDEICPFFSDIEYEHLDHFGYGIVTITREDFTNPNKWVLERLV